MLKQFIVHSPCSCFLLWNHDVNVREDVAGAGALCHECGPGLGPALWSSTLVSWLSGPFPVPGLTATQTGLMCPQMTHCLVCSHASRLGPALLVMSRAI
jgi:hypothetical protein